MICCCRCITSLATYLCAFTGRSKRILRFDAGCAPSVILVLCSCSLDALAAATRGPVILAGTKQQTTRSAGVADHIKISTDGRNRSRNRNSTEFDLGRSRGDSESNKNRKPAPESAPQNTLSNQTPKQRLPTKYGKHANSAPQQRERVVK